MGRPAPTPTKVFLAFWFTVTVIVAGTLLSRHLLALPAPVANPQLAKSVGELRTEGDRPVALHVFYAECKCSRRIIDHLLESPRPKNVQEHVLMVGELEGVDEKLVAHGFRVSHVDAEELAPRYGVRAVPMLVVASGDGAVRYAGGYTTRKQGPEPRDVQIIETIASGGGIASLPIYGCAVANDLRKRLDPTGLL